MPDLAARFGKLLAYRIHFMQALRHIDNFLSQYQLLGGLAQLFDRAIGTLRQPVCREDSHYQHNQENTA
jgi:hypothetical protein